MNDVPSRENRRSAAAARRREAHESRAMHAELAAAAPPVTEAAPASATAAALERAELANQIEATEVDLYTCHQGEFSGSPEPGAAERERAWYYNPPAEAPDLEAVTLQLYRQFTEALPWYRLFARRTAKLRAAETAVDLVERMATEAEVERELARQEAEHAKRLESDDPEVVIAILDGALGDIDAVVETIEGGVALVRLLVPSVEHLIGALEPTVTAAGRATVKKRSNSRRNLIYSAVLASRTIRIAKVAFAGVPKLRGVRVCIDQMGEHDTHVIYEGLVRRSTRLFWNTNTADPEELARTLATASEVLIDLQPRTGELRPLYDVPAPVAESDPEPEPSPALASRRPRAVAVASSRPSATTVKKTAVRKTAARKTATEKAPAEKARNEKAPAKKAATAKKAASAKKAAGVTKATATNAPARKAAAKSSRSPVTTVRRTAAKAQPAPGAEAPRRAAATPAPVEVAPPPAEQVPVPVNGRRRSALSGRTRGARELIYGRD